MPLALLLPILFAPPAAHASPQAADSPPPVVAVFERGEARPRIRARRRPVLAEEATTALSGRLFYEDHRQLGRHAARLDLEGRPGRSRKRRPDAHGNYVGALWMTVDIFELDRPTALGRGCHRVEWVGTTTVQADGTFSFDVPASDRCAAESDTPPHYVIRASTRYCTDAVCFQLGPRNHTTYDLWFGRDTPLSIGRSPERENILLFTPLGKPDKSVEARAANHYASLIDTVHALHIEGQVPFLLDPYGPVQVRFPSPWSRGRATRHNLVDIRNSGWPKGALLMHEYAHIVHRRAWGGDYGGFPEPTQSWSGSRHSREIPFIAFKEGWANFVTSYTIGRCFRPDYDTRDDLFSLNHPADGIHFPQNHQRALCDWVDDLPDPPNGAEVGDIAHITIAELWGLLDQTDDLQDQYDSHDPVRQGLDFCDLMAAHLSARSAVPPDEYRARVQAAYGILELNDLACPVVTDAWGALRDSAPRPSPNAPQKAQSSVPSKP